MIVVLIGAAVVALVVIVVLARGRRVPDGVASFQRQIDALSPEARRPVVQRLEDVTKRDDAGNGAPDRDDDPRAGGPHHGDPAHPGDPHSGGTDGA